MIASVIGIDGAWQAGAGPRLLLQRINLAFEVDIDGSETAVMFLWHYHGRVMVVLAIPDKSACSQRSTSRVFATGALILNHLHGDFRVVDSPNALFRRLPRHCLHRAPFVIDRLIARDDVGKGVLL